MHIMSKDAMLVVRLSQEVKDALRRGAAEDERSLSSLVAWVLREWARRKGYLDTKPAKGRRA